MRKRENLLREVILNDRLMLSRDTADMICYDLKTVLSEYFNLLGDVSISVEPEKDFYKIQHQLMRFLEKVHYQLG